VYRTLLTARLLKEALQCVPRVSRPAGRAAPEAATQPAARRAGARSDVRALQRPCTEDVAKTGNVRNGTCVGRQLEEGKGGPVVKTDAMHMGRRLRLRVYRTWLTRPPRSRAPPSSGAPSALPRTPGRRAPPAAPLASPLVPLPRSPRQSMLRTLLLPEPPLLADVGRGAVLGSGGGRAASCRPLQAEGARGRVAGRPVPDAAGPEGSSPRSEQASADLAPRSVRCAHGARAVRQTL